MCRGFLFYPQAPLIAVPRYRVGMEIFVTPAWVANRLQSPGLVILDATLPPVGIVPVADVRARYLAKHLPGAVFFDIEALSDADTSLPHMLPAKTKSPRKI